MELVNWLLLAVFMAIAIWKVVQGRREDRRDQRKRKTDARQD